MRLEQESGKSVFNRCGGLYLGAPNGDYLPDLLGSIRRNGIDYEQLSEAEVRARFPEHHLENGEAGIFEPSAGFLKTHEAVAAAVDVGVSNGARVQAHAPIHAANRQEETSHGVKLISGDKSWTADQVLITAGAGSRHCCPKAFGPKTHVRRIFFDLAGLMKQGSPERFRPEQFPIFVDLVTCHMSMYGAPSIDDYMVKATLDDRSMPIDDVRDELRTLSTGRS